VLIRLLIIAVAVVIASLALRLNRRFAGAPPWLVILHQVIFYGALTYAVLFVAVFIALRLFGYEL
jgi:hypothetical protein